MVEKMGEGSHILDDKGEGTLGKQRFLVKLFFEVIVNLMCDVNSALLLKNR